MSHDTNKLESDFMLKAESPWGSAYKIAAVIGLVGAGIVGAFMGKDPERFAFSYVFAFFVFLTIALGSAFFVLVQRLTSAGWSVTVRRTAEFLAFGLVAMSVLALPIIWKLPVLCEMLKQDHGAAEHSSLLVSDAHAADIRPSAGPKVVPTAASMAITERHADHAPSGKVIQVHDEPSIAEGHADAHAAPAGHDTNEHGGNDHAAAGHATHDPSHVAHEETLQKKSAWFAKNFFYGRSIFYVLAWALLGWSLFNQSVRQDKSKDPAYTLQAQSRAPLGTILFAFSLTFAAFDWVMALEPAWFSTIWGVYVFATAVVSSLAVIILITMSLRDAGVLKDVVTVEHYHDLGKLLFGFNVFWAYIGFSQFMLIWYASLPEETIFYHMRWDDPGIWWAWQPLGLLLVLGHFVFPFLLLISRHSKRTHLNRLKFGAAWLLVMHVIEWFWLVMPNLDKRLVAAKGGFALSLLDVGCLLMIGGFYFATVFWRMTQNPMIPVGDPRLQRSIHFQNA